MSTTHLFLPRVFNIYICSGEGVCPLSDKIYLDVLIQEPLPDDSETLARLDLRWPEATEPFISFACTDKGYIIEGLRWFNCNCDRAVLETIDWPWSYLEVDANKCGEDQKIAGGESPDAPLILAEAEQAGILYAKCSSIVQGGKVCVAGVDRDAVKAYGIATCFQDVFEGWLPIHRGVKWAIYGDGGVDCTYYICYAQQADNPLPVVLEYVFVKLGGEIRYPVQATLFLVKVIPWTGVAEICFFGTI